MFVTNLTEEQRLSKAVVAIMGNPKYTALAGVMMIYGFTFGIGNLIFQNYSASVILFGFAGIGSYLIWNRNISKLT